MALGRENLLAFLRDELGLDTSGIENDTELFSSGLIDSFSLVSLISFLEETEQFRISPMDVSLDNLDTVGRILDFVERVKASA